MASCNVSQLLHVEWSWCERATHGLGRKVENTAARVAIIADTISLAYTLDAGYDRVHWTGMDGR